MIRKLVSVCLLALFIAYSGGIGFLLRTCDHCNKVNIHFFQSAECCSASEETEHCSKNRADTEEEAPLCCQEQGCSHEDAIPETSYTANAEQCCVFEFVYFKINASYLVSQYEKIVQPETCCNLVSFDLLREDSRILLNETTEDKVLPEKIPPLIPGGERFIIYSHQLLFYA